MGLSIQDRIDLSIYIGGKEYVLDAMNTLNALHIAVNSRSLVPVLGLSVTDAVGQMTRTTLLADATPIVISIKARGARTPRIYRFTLFKFERQTTPSGQTYLIHGYYDSLKYWLTRVSEGMRGNSSEIMRIIADRCGLETDLEQTSDTQLWLPQNRTYAQFVASITDRGWASESSFMRSVLTAEGVLRYKDVNKEMTPVLNYSQGGHGENAIPVVDYAPKSNSGFGNAVTGYHSVARQQKVMEDTVHQEVSSLEFKPNAKTPMYNVKARSVVERGAQRFGPIDFGNVHENYEKAKYQNMRYGNLMSYGIELMTFTTTNQQVLDTFNFAVELQDNVLDSANSGNYVCTAWTCGIERNEYYEKIEGYRHGTNEVANA